jgi:hypothetical protein
MSTDSDTVQTARTSYDPALLAEASGFAEVVQPARALSLEPLDLDLGELSEERAPAPAPAASEEAGEATADAAPGSEERGFDTEPGLGAAPRAAEPDTRAELQRIPHGDGTLILPLAALHPQDKTLVLAVPPRPHLEHTLVIAPPPVTVLNPAGASGDAGAETRVVPLEAWAPGAAAAPELPRRAASAAPGGERPGPLTALARKFRELPMRQRILAVLAPVTFVAVAQSYLEPSPSERGAPRGSRAAESVPASTGVTRAAVPAARATPAPRTESRPASVRPAPGKSLERAAADAVAEGNTAAALAIYKNLAAAKPDVPAYRAAVRILEDRLRGAEQ